MISGIVRVEYHWRPNGFRIPTPEENSALETHE